MVAPIIEALGPVIAMFMIMGIPILAILSKHQQKMAKIIREDAVAQPNPQVETLRREVEVLRATVNQQTILMDTIANQQREIMASLNNSSERLEQRLSS
jgi:tRNA A22 N-methylase